MNYPQHPEKKQQRRIRLKNPHFWGVWDEICSDELSDDESVTTISAAVVVVEVAVVAVAMAVVVAVAAVFSCNNNF